jgi:type VI secretion system protein VasJ
MNLESLGREPISAEHPTGTDIRYDPAFEELQAEIEKLSSPSAIGGLDWAKVVRLASDILAQKSKDLLVASYLAVALIYTQKEKGLSIGLKIYRDLLEQFWEGLYPSKSRMRGRVGAIEWWVEKTGIALEPLEQIPFPLDQVNQFLEDLEKIDQLLSQNLDQRPAISPIRDSFKRIAALSKEQVKQEVKKEVSPPPAPEKAKEEVIPTVVKKVEEIRKPEIAKEISSVEDAQRVLDYGFQSIRQAVTYLREKDLSNPKNFRWTRIIAWSRIDILPSARDGLTEIPPPVSHFSDPLLALKSSGNYEALVRSIEVGLPQCALWIDLNRFASEALIQLGEKYQKAHETICTETAFFIHRLPGLENLSFSDGTPFADGETKQWLREIALGPGSVTTAPFSTSKPILSAGNENPIEKEKGEAQALIKKGKLLEAVERLQEKLNSSSSQKEKLLWRLALSELLVSNKQSKVVLPHLEQVLKEIDIYRLEEYDPQLALRSLRVVWLGFHSQSDQTCKDKANETLQRIARIDLGEMIRLGKS